VVKLLAIYLAMLDNEDDKNRLAQIYEDHKSVMLRYALSITQNREMAEDAVHNAILSIINHKDKLFAFSFRELRATIIIITKNRCIDLLRKEKKVSFEQIDEMDAVLTSKDITVEGQVLLLDEYNSIRKHIASLDEISQLVLEMKYISGMTYKEIGAELDMTAKHVDTKIMRAKAKVRKLMERGGETIG